MKGKMGNEKSKMILCWILGLNDCRDESDTH